MIRRFRRKRGKKKKMVPCIPTSVITEMYDDISKTSRSSSSKEFHRRMRYAGIIGQRSCLIQKKRR